MRAAVLHGAEDMRVESRTTPAIQPGMVLIRNRRVGVCGSDLHYFQHGYCAAFVPDRPFVLGHELCGEVIAVGDGVETPTVGERVTVNPARSCLTCSYCKQGRPNLCTKIIMLGSASTTPPTDGAFAELVSVRADQCHALPDGLDDGLAAMTEPFAVALHAVKRAMPPAGKSVLVMGGGAIGLLVATTARAFGARCVVLADIVAERLTFAEKFACDATVNPSKDLLGQLAGLPVDEGFDLVFEASGARPALRQAFDLVRPGGDLVQIGTVGNDDVPLPANLLMNREIRFIGSMRYGDVFDEALQLMSAGRVDLSPLISRVVPLADSAEAMRLAGNKSLSVKVQIDAT